LRIPPERLGSINIPDLSLRRAIHITPKQLRTLTGLFIFLPLVPIALFGWLVFKSEKILDENVPIAVRDLHEGYLHRLVQAMPAEMADPVAMLGYFESGLPDGCALRITDRRGGVLATTKRQIASGSERLSVTLTNGFRRWRVQVSGLPGTPAQPNPELGRDMRREVKIAYMALVILLAAASAAGIAVFRGLKLEALKNDTLTAISHELKTPVASIRLLLETLQERGVDDKEQVKDYVDLMLQENERVSHMVEDFLNHTRLEEKQKRFKMERLRADQIAGEAVRRFEAKIEELGGRIRCFGRDVGMPLIHGDHQTLVMVLGILIDNAIQYSEEPDIEVDFFSDARRVYFLVKDRGIGVPKIHRKRIFDKFYQANPKLSRKGGGCGLGLSIARHVIAAHGGVIEHEPRRGAGSIFRFDVPVSVLGSDISTLATKSEASTT
jgi:signal transduction histidine kinase